MAAARPLKKAPKEEMRFGPFRLDPQTGGLWCGDTLVHLRPKTWEVLCLLAANPGRLLTKEEILDAIWQSTLVSDTMPSISVAELRRALQDDPKRPRYLETVHGRGFRFIAEIERAEETGLSAKEADHLGHGLGSTFVGRDLELTRLKDLLANRDPHSRVILISGDPGIGKTSLIHALLERIGNRKTSIVGSGQCLAHFGEGHSYLPIFGALRSMCLGNEQMLAHLRELAPSWLARLPALVSAAELDELRQRTTAVSPSRLVDEIAALLRAAGPVVWILEDLHWADDATLELVTILAENSALEEFHVIGTVRLAEAVGRSHSVTRMRRELLRRGRCRELMLEGLCERDVENYLARRLPDTPYPDWLAARLLRRSNGNPFFLVHTVDHLQSTGALSAGEVVEAHRSPLEEALDAIPATLRELIEEDIGRLTDSERQVLDAASLAGLEVDAAMIAAALAAEVEASDTSCSELARRTPFLERIGETAWPDGTVSGRYAFRHALYQKVIYENLPPAARRAAHCRIGRALAVGFGERAHEIATVIADHFERGGDNEQATTFHLMAAHAASERHASREAAFHLRRALTLLPSNSPGRESREATILTELGKVLPALHGFGDPSLQDVYIRARALRAKGADPGAEVTLLIGQLLANLMQSQPQPAEEIAREMLELTAQSEDPGPRTHAEILMGVVLYHQGDLVGTIDHANRALVLGPGRLTFGPIDQHCNALVMSGAALWQAGYPDTGLERALAASKAASGDMHPFNRVTTLQALVAIHQWRGEVAATMDTARDLARAVRDQGILQAEACALLIEGWALFESDDHTAAIERVDNGVRALREYGTMMQSVYLLAVAVEVLIGVGRLGEASDLLNEAAALIEDGAARWWEPELHRWRGVLLSMSGNKQASAEAEACFQASCELAALQGSASLYLRTAISRTSLRRGAKRRGDARQALQAALGDIHGGADTRDVQAAQRLLAQ